MIGDGKVIVSKLRDFTAQADLALASYLKTASLAGFSESQRDCVGLMREVVVQVMDGVLWRIPSFDDWFVGWIDVYSGGGASDLSVFPGVRVLFNYNAARIAVRNRQSGSRGGLGELVVMSDKVLWRANPSMPDTVGYERSISFLSLNVDELAVLICDYLRLS
jgi:hypothetical protein